MKFNQKDQRKSREIVSALLHEALGSEAAVSQWLKSPNPDFGGLIPEDLMSQGKYDAIIDYLKNIQNGQLS